MAEQKNVNVEEKKHEESPAKASETSITNPEDRIVRKYMWWSAGAGFIPVPFLDVGALAGIQLKMLSDLSKQYGVRFNENRGKSIIATLIGIITADSLRQGTFTSFVKSIPLLGFLGVISMPFYSVAVSYAIGKTFIMHFESGGTLLNFDTQKVKSSIGKLYEEGKTAASRLTPKTA